MSDSRTAAIQYVQQKRPQFIDELKAFTAIPSISTSPEHKPQLKQGAEWLAEKLRQLDLNNVQIFQTAGHPVVYGEDLSAGSDKPVVLVYGHYDVQPADPLDLWESSPFNATLRGENLYARGATDMKGQILAALNAYEAITQSGDLPVNFKFIFEGEEEIGSTHLEEFIVNHQDLLACDMCLNPDTGMLAKDLPTITYGLRGLVYFEINVYGPNHDLHSGTFGGVVHNPAQVLCDLISGMHDDQGRITLPGFYDKVLYLDDEEREELARLPTGESFYLTQSGAPVLWGEPEYTPVERATGRPTLEVNGMLSGFTGEGQKTVLPAQAMAKISCRTVANQEPGEIHQQLLQYLAEHAPDTVRYEVTKLSEGPSAIVDRNSLYITAMISAMETVWGVRPIFRREGGSVPAVAHVQKHLGVDTVNIGFALPGDNMHSPNEKLHLPTWELGMQALIHFFYNL